MTSVTIGGRVVIEMFGVSEENKQPVIWISELSSIGTREQNQISLLLAE